MPKKLTELEKIANLSPNKKGKLNEKRSHEYLSAKLGITYTVPKLSHHNKVVDVFNCFDHIGKISNYKKPIECETVPWKKGEAIEKLLITPGYFFLAQTKSNDGYYTSRKSIIEYATQHGVAHSVLLNISWQDNIEEPYIEMLFTTIDPLNKGLFKFKQIKFTERL